MLMHAADANANAVAVTVWAPPKTWSPVIVAGVLRKLVNERFDPYRPEFHYRPGSTATFVQRMNRKLLADVRPKK